MNIVVLGPQGSGKSTQARKIAEYLNIPHFSTGQKVKEIDANPDHPLNSLIRSDFEAGRLVSNAVVNKILNEAVEHSLKQGGIVIDGTPRSRNQVDYLDEALALFYQKIDLAIFVDTSIEECKRRIALRMQIEHRVDDTPEAIDQRLKIYFEQTLPILEEYEKRGVLVKVDGNPGEESVFQNVLGVLKSKFNK